MRIAIMQPTYLPWLGYFELMANCELFVFLDDVQFVKKSWHHRNRIKNQQEELLLTVPVKNNYKQLIKEVCIDNSLPWKRKHFASIQVNYRKTAFFKDYIDKMEAIYAQDFDKLVALNVAMIDFLKIEMGINVRHIYSSELNVTGISSERILNICRALNADTLYDASGARAVLDPSLFIAHGIELVFQDYKHPVYTQVGGDFISKLSTLDLLFNEGCRALEILLSGSTIKK